MLIEKKSHCPYCGEPITLVVDPSVSVQEYTEDCFVCCRPIIVHALMDGDDVYISLKSEDE